MLERKIGEGAADIDGKSSRWHQILVAVGGVAVKPVLGAMTSGGLPGAVPIDIVISMAQLVVRNLDDDVKAKLRRRADAHGRSMEAEVREILRDAVKEEARPKEGLGTRIANRFAGIGLRKGEEIQEFRGYRIKPVTFD